MTTTPKTGAPELAVSQASKEATVNEALRIVEAGSALFRVEDNDATAPPGSCADGAQYIPAATATGDWAGHEDDIAIAAGTDASNGWYFITPEDGMRAWVKDEGLEYAYDGAAWSSYSPTPAPGSMALDDLSDVDASSPADGDTLVYDADSPSGWRAGKIAPSIQSVTSSATVTPTFANDQVNITAQAAGLTLANPTGTAVPAWGMVIRIKDNGTARAITYDTQYRAIGVTLPTTTVINKTLYLGCIWNSTDSKLDVVAVAQEA